MRARLLVVLCAVSGTTLHAEPPPADARPCGWTDEPSGERPAALVERRRAKCAVLEGYRPGFVEKQILAFEKAERPPITQLNLFGLYPRIQTIDHRSQLAPGVRLWRPELRGSSFDLAGNAFWSFQGFEHYDAQAGVIPHRKGGFPLFVLKGDDVFELANVRQDDARRYMLYASLAHRWAPEFDYFGSGPDSQREDQAGFSQNDTLVEGVGGYRFFHRLTLSGRFGHYEATIGPGQDEDLPQIEEVFDPTAVPGFHADQRFWRYGAAAVFDTRDVTENAHRGGLLAVQWLRFDERDAEGFSFHRFGVDGRAYFPLGHPQRVLALRAYASRDDPDPGNQVPFYLQAYLGGSHTLRGFDSQRFRGEKLALFQAEYRWEPLPAIELALFADTGAVAATSEDEMGPFRTDGGFGLRFKSRESVFLRFDFAWSEESFRFFFRFSAAF